MATLADKRSNYLRRAAHQLSVPRANLNCLFAATIVAAWKVESWPRITRTKQGEKNEGDSDFNSCIQSSALNFKANEISLVSRCDPTFFFSLSLSLSPLSVRRINESLEQLVSLVGGKKSRWAGPSIYLSYFRRFVRNADTCIPVEELLIRVDKRI